MSDPKLTITFQRGDATMLYSQGEIGHDGEDFCVSTAKGPRRHGKIRESCHIILQNGIFPEPLRWPRGGKREGRTNYPRDAFWTVARYVRGNGPGNDDVMDPFTLVTHFVWVWRYEWYAETPDEHWSPSREEIDAMSREEYERRCALAYDYDRRPHIGSELEILIRPAPVQGWRRLYIEADPFRDVLISGGGGTALTAPGGWHDDSLTEVLSTKFHQLAMDFEDRVVEAGLREIVESCDERGLEFRIEDVQVTKFDPIGHMIFQLERGSTRINFVGNDSPPGQRYFLGAHGCHGTYAAIELMVHQVIGAWQAHTREELQQLVKPNRNIRFGL